MNNRNNADDIPVRNYTKGRCDNTLTYLSYLSEAQCSSAFFQKEKCEATLAKIEEIAEHCARKYTRK